MAKSKPKTHYAIGEVAALCDVSIKTLRYYDKIGLLTPAYRKDDSNYRYYTHEQLLTVFIIRKLRVLGVPIKEIQRVVTAKGSTEMRECIEKRLTEITKERDALTQQYETGQQLLDRLSKGHNTINIDHPDWSTEDIRIEEIAETPVIYTRRIKHNYKNSDVSVDRWFEIFEMVHRHKLQSDGSVILTYHNEPLGQFFEQDCDLEISIRVNELKKGREFKMFGGFQAATALHIGRNEDIVQSHIRAIKWLRQEGYAITGPVSEEYLISPVDIGNEEEHITKIIIPVKKERQAR